MRRFSSPVDGNRATLIGKLSHKRLLVVERSIRLCPGDKHLARETKGTKSPLKKTQKNDAQDDIFTEQQTQPGGIIQSNRANKRRIALIKAPVTAFELPPHGESHSTPSLVLAYGQRSRHDCDSSLQQDPSLRVRWRAMKPILM